MKQGTPTTLTVIIADTHRTYMSIVHEQEWVPYTRRTVHIKLTPEQRAQLERRTVGRTHGEDRHEEYVGCWLEKEAE